ncbi:hypothetical protein K458DRAFT_400968 [Lentithecium fluviatile CBS 122367]|uniref:Uncharacterized protein n=1 Tax=Lentithecium fluviatile CBS 122367 TaxID=1168545 RepID=A0A6G1JE81_9PLEO|nr:hypothetical protein K458DRAFT_400968 [Lentithecium fluviatile CBS 122367]
MTVMTETSALLRLPRELRDDIYEKIFRSTRLSYGRRIIIVEDQDIIRDIRPAPNSLAILRTCHQINAETRGAWIGRVTFNFENKREALVKLTALPTKILSQIRHVCVIECTPYAFDLDEHSDETFPLSTLISHIPGLRLDTLTIVRDSMTESLDFFADYIKHGCGWRELRCVMSSTLCLLDPSRHGRGKETGQDIGHRTAKIIATECKTSVAIFQAHDTSVRGSIMHPAGRELLNTDALNSISDELLNEQGDAISAESLWNREVLLVARRRSSVDITVSPCGEAPPFPSRSSRPIRFSEYKGARALEELLAMYQIDSYVHPEAAAIEAPVEIDTYRDIHDFIWPQNSYNRLLPEEYVAESLQKKAEEDSYNNTYRDSEMLYE